MELIFFNMSFFNDFLDSINVDDFGNKVCCSLVFDYGVRVNANFKIESLLKDEVILKCKKVKIKVFGKDLEVVSIASGEIEICGKIDGVIKL